MKFENATTTAHFGFGINDNLAREITIIAISSFSISSFIEILSVHTTMQSQRFQIPSASKSVYKKTPFLRRINVDGGPSSGSKTAFSNFSDVVSCGLGKRKGFFIFTP